MFFDVYEIRWSFYNCFWNFTGFFQLEIRPSEQLGSRLHDSLYITVIYIIPIDIQIVVHKKYHLLTILTSF